ncbi:HNH endonuclease signature motif containing protein [Mycolicibacterium sp. 120270]|uniref:HNH endonuclease signature motif containing protein n=2 Tax=Mycolicibacterium sp. 120270 TaxID=3090600 RepID=UPI00299F415C|nr:HNH endonuclease signature motif containing protein [Mycolicibacterium sp. 120270]MDX1885442.1 HNH endonuclease signature motif containing protein [Mycolicibacterium sp. 120270]
MSSSAPSFVASPPREARLEVLFEELAELTGQRNAIDARIVDTIAEIDRDNLWGNTGCRSVAALVAWKTGASPANAATIAAVAERVGEFPLCAQGMREGRLSLDQVGVIATRAADGSDAHYAQLARAASVSQLRTAVKLEPRPDPKPGPPREQSISKTSDGEFTCWRIKLAGHDAAKFEAALNSHRDALIAEWKRDQGIHEATDESGDNSAAVRRGQRPPMPKTLDAFMRLVEAGWDADVAARPHGQHTTVVMHLDLKDRIAALHLGPLLPDGDRQYLTCDATCEVWFERDGQPIGAGRTTRLINRRLRRALEHRHPTCAVPGCGATRGLHAHHIRHWEDGGATELDNLVLVCPYHHRMHHRGEITITGPADKLIVTDRNGKILTNASLARPPTKPPPAVAPWHGTSGERAQWWWYTPYEPKAPPNTN